MIIFCSNFHHCWIKMIGVWILADAWYSLVTYWGKETFKQDHIRWIRLILGIFLILGG